MFLKNGREIAEGIKRIVENDQCGEIRVAVAYWGQGADFELKDNFRIICDLDSGCCNPKVIESYLNIAPKRIKRLPKLHAKVILSDNQAIVSSANISTNGLGLEGSESSGNYEAGYFTEFRDDVLIISNWFEELWQRASFILADDLKYAQRKWDARKIEASKLIFEGLDPFELLQNKIDSNDRLRACNKNILRICKLILNSEDIKDQELGKISTWSVHLMINCSGKIMDYGKGSSGKAGEATNEWIHERIKNHNPEVTKPRIEKILSALKDNQEITRPARRAASQALINLPWRNL